MAKVDRLGWTAGRSFDSFGLTVGLRATSEHDLDVLLERLPPGATSSVHPVVDRLYSYIPAEGRRTRHLLFSDSDRIATTEDASILAAAFESDVQLFVAGLSPAKIFIHAGVVERQGRAIVIPGPSFSGKSTLVEALVKAGATYYSDEYAVVCRDGKILPYPRALNLREGSGMTTRRMGAGDLGGRTGSVAIEAGLIVFTRFEAGADWNPVQLSSAAAAQELLQNTVSARLKPREALSAAKMLLASGVAFQGVRGEATEVARAILSSVDGAGCPE